MKQTKITYILITILLFSQAFFCKKTEKPLEEKEEIIESYKVSDKTWDGDEKTIPEVMQKDNPIANPQATKGGSFRLYGHQYPKSLNYYLEQYSTTARIFTSLFETLTINHPITLENIPHLAKAWKISKDKKKFTFEIDQNAKWSDDKPITADDVLFTFKTIMDPKNNTPVFRIGLSRFEEPKKIDEFTVEFTAKKIHWDNFNTIATGLMILPKHYYEGKDFNKENFEFPVVSGAYKLVDVKQNRYIRLGRRGDYWQRAYPFAKGRNNFDEVIYKFYNEEGIAFQSFVKGDIDFFPVYRAATWIDQAKGEKFDKNLILKQRIFNQKPIGFQGWAMNMRREIFKDKKVRKALAYLVNRKLMIEKLAFNQYSPTNSYYPDYYLGNETNPNEEIDFNVEKAKELFKEAGYIQNAKGILEKDGKEFSFTILDRDKSTEKYFTVFMEDAKKVGVKANIETTDLAGFSKRIDEFDFDLAWTAWGSGVFKDPEGMWYSKYADQKMQQNITGFKNKKVDELIEKQKSEFSKSKRDMIVKEIDKIIYAEHPYILLWHLDNTRLLYWNKFSTPEIPLGRYGTEDFATDYWWFDKTKSENLSKAIKENLTLNPEITEFKIPPDAFKSEEPKQEIKKEKQSPKKETKKKKKVKK